MSFAVLIYLSLGSCIATNLQRTVYPIILEERGSDASLVLQIAEGLSLSLTKASVAAEKLRFRSYRDGNIVGEFVNGSELEETLFEDRANMATVSLSKSLGIRVTGLLSLTERIYPVAVEERDYTGPIPHVVQQIETPSAAKKVVINERKDFSPRNCSDPTLPKNITVELYVVSDTRHNRRFGSEKDLFLYICIFLNSMNAVFMSIKCPNVRLALVGVEKSNKLAESSFVFGNEQMMNDVSSLTLFRTYANKQREAYGNPDVVLLLTGRDIYESDGRKVNRNVLGIAYEGGICSTNFVALTEDIAGSYSGIIDAAHELGHSLGASHDGSPPNDHIYRHPGSLTCSATTGYIMTYVDGGPLRYQFSECNKREIRHVLRYRGESCWAVNAHKIYSVQKVYPGRLFGPKQYCKLLYPSIKGVYSRTDGVRNSHCKLRCCAHIGHKGEVCAIQRMLDHMSCGYRKMCFQGVCKNEAEILGTSNVRGVKS